MDSSSSKKYCESLFPPRNPDAWTTDPGYSSLEQVMEKVYRKVHSSGKKSIDIDDDEPIDIDGEQVRQRIESSQEEKELSMVVNGVSTKLYELFWQVKERFNIQMKDKDPGNRGIRANRVITGCIIHAGLTPFERVRGQRPPVSNMRIKALNNGDDSALTNLMGKAFKFASYFDKKHGSSLRIGFLTGWDKLRTINIHDDFGWPINNVINLILIFGVANSSGLLPWDNTIVKAREEVKSFFDWYIKNY